MTKPLTSADVWTNAVYLLPAVVVWQDYNLYALCWIFLGIGSFAFHRNPQDDTKRMTDEQGIYAVLGYTAIGPYCLILMVLAPFLPSTPTIGVLLGFITIKAFVVGANLTYLFMGLAGLGMAYGLWNVDKTEMHREKGKFGLAHGIWHVVAAGGLLLLWLSFVPDALTLFGS